MRSRETQDAAKEATHLTASVCGVAELTTTQSTVISGLRAGGWGSRKLSSIEGVVEKWMDENDRS